MSVDERTPIALDDAFVADDRNTGNNPEGKYFYDAVQRLSTVSATQFAGFKQLSFQEESFNDAMLQMETELIDDRTSVVMLTQVAAGTGMALSVGFLGWILQGSALAASLLSAMPVWSTLDPLPLLAGSRSKDRKGKQKLGGQSRTNKNNLNGLFDRQSKDDEQEDGDDE